MLTTPAPADQGGNPLVGLPVLALIGYVLVWMSGGPSPRLIATLVRDWMSGQTSCPDRTNPRSDDVRTSQEGASDNVCPDTMSGQTDPPTQADLTPVAEDVPGVFVGGAPRGWRYPTPGPPPELAHLGGAGPHPEPAAPASRPPDPAAPEPPGRKGMTAAQRRDWIRWQIQHHQRSPAWLEREGARRLGVSQKTIYRDHKHLKDQEGR